MVLVLCELQSVSSSIWIRVAVSISYDDNHYTTGTSTKSVVHCAIVFSTLVYVTETLTAYKAEAQRLHIYMMRIVGKILSIKWWQRI